MASNRIENISTGLDDNTVAELNLANNRVGEFKQVLNLSRIETLLGIFRSALWRQSICNLCNYQTYVLYHLGQLTTLDSMYISGNQSTCRGIHEKENVIQHENKNGNGMPQM